MERLTAKQNEKIKAAVSIRDSAKERREKGLFFLEGARLCGDAAQNRVKIYRAFMTSGAMQKYSHQTAIIIDSAEESYEISSEISAKLSDTQTSQGIFCICRASEQSLELRDINPRGKYIFLENVQDPSNLGAISRTAEALGADGLIVCGGCDIYNPKALRASMGSALRLNIFSCESAPELLKSLGERGMLTVASTPDNTALKITDLDMSGGVVTVIGNEGNGVTEETMAACKIRATIPMLGRAESLNASTAAAILIWEMLR